MNTVRQNILALIVFVAVTACNPFGTRSTVGGGDGTLLPGALQPTLVSPSAANTNPIPVILSWPETVIGFSIADLSVTNGSPNTFGGSGSDYTFNIVPTAPGTVTITIADGACENASGEPSVATVLTISYDLTAPSVAISLTSGQNPTTGTLPVSFDVVFSEAIATASFTTSDITQQGSATGITWALTNSGDNTNFTLTATAVSGDMGMLRPYIAASAYTDIAGNSGSASTGSNRSVVYLTNYSSVKLWLRADTLALANGANVTSWDDDSSSGNDVSEATNPPTCLTPAQNSLPAVRFAGGSTLLRSTSNSGITGNPDMTIFVVAKVNGAVSSYPTFLQIGETSSDGASAWFGLDGATSNIFSGFYNGGTKSTATASASFALYTWVRDSASGTANSQTGNTQYWNGASATTATSLATNAVSLTDGKFRIGRSTLNVTANADIAEIMVFHNTALGAATRSQIESYLNGKWNLY